MSEFDSEEKTRRVRPQYLPEEVVTRRLNQLRTVRPLRATAQIHAFPDVMHLAELVPVVRERLEVPADFSDDAILGSLKMIAARTSDRDRWRAAFDSNLARYLSVTGQDMGEALQILIAVLPSPRS
ncbi:MAG: hypothetical protein RIC14_16545 [Filomicrobium sp.]